MHKYYLLFNDLTPCPLSKQRYYVRAVENLFGEGEYSKRG
jgi:hypothetical protein